MEVTRYCRIFQMRQPEGVKLSPSRLPLAPRIPTKLHCGLRIAGVEHLKELIKTDPIPDQDWQRQMEAVTEIILESKNRSVKMVEDACLIAWLLHPPVKSCHQIGSGPEYFWSFQTELRQRLRDNTLLAEDGGTENPAAQKTWKTLTRFYQDIIKGRNE